MPRDRSFWRNLTLIGLLHGGVLFGLSRCSTSAKQPLGRDIVWMEDGAAPMADSNTLEEPARAANEDAAQPTPAEEKGEEPLPAATASDLPLATPTPSQRPPAPTASPTPKPLVRPTPKPSPKPTPKKKLIAKATPPPKRIKKTSAPTETTKISTGTSTQKGEGTATASGGHGSGTANPSQFGWYGNMLHNRFFSEWEQPTSIVSNGVKMSVLVRLRIEKDGRVSDFALVRPSGNIVVDESVAAVAKRVTQVDPLPAGLGSGGHYEVNINFELNSGQ